MLDYHQTENISYTDVEWTFLPMATVQKVFYINVPLYRYTLGREGQTVDPKVSAVKFGDNVIGFANKKNGKNTDSSNY